MAGRLAAFLLNAPARWPAPDERYCHPRGGLPGRLGAWLLNARRLARLRHALFARLPFPVLESDVVDVVYLTWMVDLGAAQAMVPPGVWLRDCAGKTPFTVLTYRHGHFGPRALGRLRGLFPSPLQSNWRLYLDPARHPDLPDKTVYFVKNVMDSALYTFATRLSSDIMQTHLAAALVHQVDGGRWRTMIAAGAGSAPALACTAVLGEPGLPPGFAHVGGWVDAVGDLACQDAAIGWADRQERMALAHIDLPIALDEVRPLKVEEKDVDCPLLARLGTAGPPLAFVVPRVRFRVLSERLL